MNGTRIAAENRQRKKTMLMAPASISLMKKPPRLQNPAAASSIIRAANGEGSFRPRQTGKACAKHGASAR